MLAKLWHRTGHHKWHGRIDPIQWEAHTDHPYSSVAHIGCGARYRPFARGQGMVCEFGCGDHQYAILADLLPEMLDKEVTKHQAAWVEASLLLKPDELKAALPVIYPKMNIVEGLPLPCVGRFDVRKAKEENWPKIDTKAWWTLASAIYEKDCDDGGDNVFGSGRGR